MEADEETRAAVLELPSRAQSRRASTPSPRIPTEPTGCSSRPGHTGAGFTLLRNENQGESQLKEAINLTRQAILRLPRDWQAHYFYSFGRRRSGRF